MTQHEQDLAQYMIDVLTAWKEGKPIEYKMIGPINAPWIGMGVSDPPADWNRFDYRVVETKPSLDWSHLGRLFNYVARTYSGKVYAFSTKPRVAGSGLWNINGVYRVACINDIIESLDPGTCDWRDSLVYRVACINDIIESLDPGTCDWRDSLIVRPGHEEGTE